MGNTLNGWGSSSYHHTFVQAARVVADEGSLVLIYKYTVGYTADKRRELDATCSKPLAETVRVAVEPMLEQAVAHAPRFVSTRELFWRGVVARTFHDALRQHGFYLQGEFILERIAIDADAFPR